MSSSPLVVRPAAGLPPAAPRAVHRGRLFRKYLLLILSLVTIALLASGAIGIYFSYQENKSALASLQHEKALAAASRIEQYIERIEQQLKYAALPQLASSETELRRLEFLKLLRQVPEVTDVAQLDGTGHEQVLVSRLGMDVIGSGKDRSGEDAFRHASRGQTWFGPVYFRKETEPYMVIAVRSGSDTGPVTIADVNLKFIWDVVSKIKIGDKGKAYVVDSNGFLVADPDIGLVLRKTNLGALPHVKAASDAMATLEPAMVSSDAAGTPVLTSVAFIEPLRWRVFVEQPVAEVYAKLDASILRTALLLLAGLVVSALGALALARGMVRPIRMLDESARRIGAGNLDQVIEVHTGDELEALADQFNRMTAQLRESYAGLERKVDERTRELKSSLDQQTAISEILRVISASPTDVQPVLDAVAERAAHLCDATVASVLLIRDGVLRPMAAYSADAGAKPTFDYAIPLQRTYITGRAAIERKTVAIEDLVPLLETEFPDVRDNQRQLGFRAVLAVPLVREGGAYGVIYLYRREPHGFAPDQIALVETFARQAAIAIENVRLFNETKEALEQQTATAEVLRVISSSPGDVQPVFDAITERAMLLCGARMGAASRLDDAGMLHLVSYRGMSAEGESLMRAAFPMPLNRSSANGRAILAAAPVEIEDVTADPEYGLTEGAERSGWRSTVAVPLLLDGRAIGAIAVTRANPGRFPAKSIALLETFARQAVLAVENVRLFNETKEALERQTATTEVLQVIARSPADVGPVFQAILKSATTLCSAERGLVFRYEGGTTRCIAEQGLSDEARAIYMAAPVRPTPESGIGRAIATRRPVHIADITDEDAYRRGDPLRVRTAELLGARTAMWVPLTNEDQVIGVFAIYRQEVRPFTDEQIRLVQTFAAQAVIAVENVRLFNETKEALEQQTAISEVLRVISSSPTDVQPVLDAIAERAANLCDAAAASMYLIDGGSLRHLASKGPSPDPVTHVDALPIDRQTLTGRAVLDRKTIRVEDLLQHAHEYPLSYDIAQRLGHRAVIVTPLLREGEPFGAILLRRNEVRPFSDRDVALLRTFGDQAAIALENERLFNETTEALERQRASGEVLAAISSSIADTAPVFGKIVESCERLFSGTLVQMNLLGDDGLVRLGTYHGPGRELIEPIYPFPVDETSATGLSIMRRAVQHFPDVDHGADVPPRARQGWQLLGIKAAIVAPMVWENKAIGAILVGRNRAGPFSDKDVALLKTFADQAVIAIQNARLFHEIDDKSRQLEIANKHKSDFLANMSHELRTPLNAIIGFSEVLLERLFGELNPKQDDYLKDIHSSGRHLLHLINDILDLSKVEAGRMELELSTFDLPNAIADAMTLIRERAQRHGIETQVDVAPDVSHVVADERKFKQILLNLLSNAVKFTPDGGRIAVSAQSRDNEVAIAVRDTGIGIAREDQDAVFEEFRQVGRSYTHKQEGTGLGLALTRRFVELHGGRIWVESEPGRGSTFTFTLPMQR